MEILARVKEAKPTRLVTVKNEDGSERTIKVRAVVLRTGVDEIAGELFGKPAEEWADKEFPTDVLVQAQGYFTTREYTDKNGVSRYVTEFHVTLIQQV